MLQEDQNANNIDQDEVSHRFETEEAKNYKNAGYFRRFLNVASSSTVLRVFALALAIIALFFPISFTIGVISAVLNFSYIAYGVYNDVSRARETRGVQKEYAIVKEIDTISSMIEKMVSADPRLVGLAETKNLRSIVNESPSLKEVAAWNIVTKSPELGLCFMFMTISLNPVVCAASSAIWIASMLNSGYSNVNYAKQMIETEDAIVSMLSKRGLEGLSQEDLVEVIRGQRAQLFALKAVEAALKEDPNIDIKKFYTEVYIQVYEENKKNFKLPDNPSILADLKSIMYTAGFSAVDGNKLYNPTYIPPEFRDVVLCAANPNMSVEVVQESKQISESPATELVNIHNDINIYNLQFLGETSLRFTAKNGVPVIIHQPDALQLKPIAQSTNEKEL